MKAEDIIINLTPPTLKEVITRPPSEHTTNIANILSITNDPANSLDISANSLDYNTKELLLGHKTDVLQLCSYTYRIFLDQWVINKYTTVSHGQAIPIGPNLWISVAHNILHHNISRRSVTNLVSAPYDLVDQNHTIMLGNVLPIDHAYLNQIAAQDCDPLQEKSSAL